MKDVPDFAAPSRRPATIPRRRIDFRHLHFHAHTQARLHL